MHLAFFDNLKYVGQLAKTYAGACLVSERFEDRVPSHVAVLRVANPFRAFVDLARELHADALRPASSCGNTGIAPSAVIDPAARLEDDVIVDPLAVIGPDAEIGSGTVVGAGAVIGPGVKIGRDCNVGAGTSIHYALIGNNVLIHPGCHIGQDGYGFIFGADGHLKVPQTGRVLIQNHEEALCATGAASRADDAGRCAEGLARIPEDAGSRALLTTRARRAIAFSSEVESGSREENASNQNPQAFHRFKVKGSSTPSRTMHDAGSEKDRGASEARRVYSRPSA